MSTHVLGPSGVVAAEHAVALQCTADSTAHLPMNHAVFTDNMVDVCSAQNTLHVFCDGKLVSDLSRFVGVIASHPVQHGSHCHVTVFVSGAVTLACVLADLGADARPMDRIEFACGKASAKMAGLPATFDMPLLTVASRATDGRASVGVLLEKGRRPANEIRVLLTPGKPPPAVAHIGLLAAYAKKGQDIVPHLTLRDLAALFPGNVDVQNLTAVAAALTTEDTLHQLGAPVL